MLSFLSKYLLCYYYLTSVTTLFLPQKVFLAAALFLGANYLYQFSFVFYNALLHYIVLSDKHGMVSGIGQAGNYSGQIAGLLLVIPFAGGALYLFGEPGCAQTFLPAVFVFFLLTLPMLIFFKIPKKEVKVMEKIKLWI